MKVAPGYRAELVEKRQGAISRRKFRLDDLVIQFDRVRGMGGNVTISIRKAGRHPNLFSATRENWQGCARAAREWCAEKLAREFAGL